VRVAFDISDEQSLAWAFPKNTDDSLYQAAKAFFDSYAKSGELKHLLARHYGHVRDYDYAGTPTYLRHVNRRLPNYRELFEQAAERTGLDWMLLAAVAYQESHWNPLAVSPTGVRGMMMLTRVTARQLQIAPGLRLPPIMLAMATFGMPCGSRKSVVAIQPSGQT